MKKLIIALILILMFINISNADELKYWIIYWQVWKINEFTISWNKFHPLRKDLDEIKFYTYKLINPKYITNIKLENLYNFEKINVIEYSDQLWYFQGWFKEEYINKKEWDFVVLDYFLLQNIEKSYKNDVDYRNEKNDIKNVYKNNYIYLDNYLNIDSIFTKINCNDEDFWIIKDFLRKWEIGDEEKNIFYNIIKKEISCYNKNLEKQEKSFMGKIIEFIKKFLKL